MFYIYLIIFLCSVVFAYQTFILEPASSESVVQFITSFGYTYNGVNSWSNYFTYGFVHNGFSHFALNMLSVYALGDALIHKLRVSKYHVLIVYFVCLVSAVFIPDLVPDISYTVVGASGAIMGLIGFIFVIVRGAVFNKNRILIGGIILVQLLVIDNLISNIDNAAHIAGVITGIVLGFAFLKQQTTEIKNE